MQKKIIILLFVLLNSLYAASQLQEVTGSVMSADEEPLIGASVQIKGTTLGTLTDMSGNFKLAAMDGQVFVISYVGFTPQEIVIAKNQPHLRVVLQSSKSLDEVVVVGYGVTRKRDLTGSISNIKTKDVKAGVVTDAAQLLKGRAAGVEVKQNNHEPGGAISVRIRGASSISNSNEPLYVVDGFQTNMGNQINPDDIESIEVLKDAATTSIYGANGANGVVIITTKKGVKNNFALDYSSSVSAKQMNNRLNKLTAKDVIDFRMRYWEENGRDGNPPYTEEQRKYIGEGTDWIKLATRTGLTQNHSITLSGGENRLLMAVSGNYMKDLGVLQNTQFNRWSGRININYQLTNRVRFGGYMYAVRTNKNYVNMGKNPANDNVLYGIFTASPIDTPDGVNVFGDPTRKVEVLSELLNVDFDNTANLNYQSFFAEANILKNLTGKVQYVYNNENNKSMKYYPKMTNIGKASNGSGTGELYKTDSHQLDALLTYHQNFDKIHNIKAIAGSTYMQYVEEGLGMQATDFSNDNLSYNNFGAAAKIEGLNSYKVRATTLSFFSRLEYVLRDRYILNATVRADGASHFGDGNKWGYFPSLSAAWQLGDEEFMGFIRPLFSSLKLRGSWGLSGNSRFPLYQSRTKFGFQYVYVGGADNVIGMYPTSPGNEKLKWETTTQYDLGVDFSLLDSRFEVNFDYYVKTTDDLINPIKIGAASSGFVEVIGNNGTIRNNGFELFIKSNNLKSKDFAWTTTLNFSKNKNIVLKLNNGEPRYLTIRPHGYYDIQEYMLLQEGQSLSSIYGYVFDGIIQKDEPHPTQPNAVPGEPKFKDLDGDGIITPNDRTVIGDGNPDIIIGLGNNLKLKNFDFSFFFDASIGAELLNITRIVMEDLTIVKQAMNRWTHGNPSNTIPRYGYVRDAGLKYGSYINSQFVEKADYLRLANIELGYTLPVHKMEKFNKYVKSLRFFVGGQNLLLLTPYTGLDPEVSTNAGVSFAQGLDYNSYPSFKSVNLGIKVTF
ncbi:MAG TPA: TonB-dependent receptor [Paludibacter sp.]|nr:TonB-dependent receptor [Bacteroidales bacterium]HOG05459.1 TonB-dependent receptor [Paludibacter sp.]HOS45426.1 TonB-dependent receptor [Paludibacter sp.]HPM08869.1 TonB-dependent receptor [Paludibacter sp.]